MIRRQSWPLAILLLAACASTPERRDASEPAKGAEYSPSGEVLTFTGACDASGAVVLDGWLFAVGDDEDNLLRLYDGSAGGAPVGAVDVSPMLGLFGKKKAPELDVEAATGLGDTALWLASHGRKSSGKLDPTRLQLFATRRVARAEQVTVVGAPFTGLLEALLADPRLAPFDLQAAAERAPKEPGGLNLEAMTAALDGTGVLIGFRSPIPGGKALVIPLQNPLEVIDGGTARFGDPHLLQLGGRGLRSLSTWRGRYLLIAGAAGPTGSSALYAWDGRGQPAQLNVDLGDLNPEAFVTPEDRDSILLLSDDGTREVAGSECKRLKDPALKAFRALRVTPFPAPRATAP